MTAQVVWSERMADEITDSYATGTVVSASNDVGRSGWGHHNDGSIDQFYATGPVTCPDSAGGLVGLLYGTITNSYATGTVTGGDDSSSISGGLVGYWMPGLLPAVMHPETLAVRPLSAA